MDRKEACFLASPEGEALLGAARETRSLPPHRRADALAGRGSRDEILAALRQDDLRVRGLAKTPHAERLLFIAEALEQATPWAVAAERAGRWPGPPGQPLHDLTAGIGMDTLATLVAGRPVVAYERDPARALLLRWNAVALGVGAGLEVRGAQATSGPLAGPLAFLDPDRRPGGRRTRDPDRFEPPISDWEPLLRGFEAAQVKVPPAGLGGEGLEAPFEVVSLAGRARERRLFLRGFGPLPPRRALALPGGPHVEGPGLPWPEPRDPAPGAFLLDPDPAVTLAGLVGDLASREGLAPVHPRIAYLLGDRPSASAPGTWMRLEAVLPARPREVDRWLAAAGVGRLTIRTRGVADEAERWRRRLSPRGPRAGTVAFLRDRRDRWIAACSLEDGEEPQRPVEEVPGASSTPRILGS